MEDDKLRDLFSSFDPELTSGADFVAKLRCHLDSVEIVRRQTAELHRCNRNAVVIAACVGFIAGLLFSLAIPYIGQAMASLQLSLPQGSLFKSIADNYLIITWLMLGSAIVFISLNAYDVAQSLLKQRASAGSGLL